MSEYIEASAIISGNHRYLLTRKWENSPIDHNVCFIMLNPSTADGTEDDPTIRRCVNFAKSWGFDSMCVVNLFSYRATDKSELKTTSSAEHASYVNYQQMQKACTESDAIICAWSNDGKLYNRSEIMRANLHAWGVWDKCYYLQMNKTGEPAHPLYLKADLIPIKYEIN